MLLIPVNLSQYLSDLNSWKIINVTGDGIDGLGEIKAEKDILFTDLLLI
jgi:hypothetical protein